MVCKCGLDVHRDRCQLLTNDEECIDGAFVSTLPCPCPPQNKRMQESTRFQLMQESLSRLEKSLEVRPRLRWMSQRPRPPSCSIVC